MGPILKNNVEMSRYIDLNKYHSLELTHPFYREMLGEIVRQIKKYPNKTKILEIGAGTGILTKFLCQLNNIQVTALEPDKFCFSLLKNYLKSNNNLSYRQDSGINFTGPEKFNIAVSSFAHHHIPYEKRFEFTKNIHSNLSENGLYIVGDELINHFKNNKELKTQLFRYHLYIMGKAISENNPKLAELELESLRSGLNGIGDFKRSEKMLEEEMTQAGFILKKKIKIGPKKPNDCGGIFVYVFEK